MTNTLRFALALPLVAALSACGNDAGDAGTGTIAESAPVAAIAAPEGQQWRDVAVETAEGGTLVGNPDAPIKLVEYGSLTCPACARFSEDGGEALLDRYVNSGKVSFELRQFAIHGPVDLMLGRLTKCGQPAATVPLSDQVWRNLESITGAAQANAPALEQAMNLPLKQRFVAAAEALGYLDFFAQRGISADQGRQCLADVAALEREAAFTQRYGSEDNISGTPTFQINGQTVDASTWAQLEPLLQRAGAR